MADAWLYPEPGDHARGYNTDQPIRERGWTHWHHLFNHAEATYWQGKLFSEFTIEHDKFSQNREEHCCLGLAVA